MNTSSTYRRYGWMFFILSIFAFAFDLSDVKIAMALSLGWVCFVAADILKALGK